MTDIFCLMLGHKPIWADTITGYACRSCGTVCTLHGIGGKKCERLVQKQLEERLNARLDDNKEDRRD